MRDCRRGGDNRRPGRGRRSAFRRSLFDRNSNPVRSIREYCDPIRRRYVAGPVQSAVEYDTAADAGAHDDAEHDIVIFTRAIECFA